MMDIYAEPGHKVKFTNENGRDEERENASKILNTEDIYTVEYINVGGWFSYVKLEGIPGVYNTVMFVDVEEDIEEEQEEIIVKRAYHVGFKTPGFSGSDTVVIAIRENANDDEITEMIKQKLSKRYNKRKIEISGFKRLNLDEIKLKDISLEDFAILFNLGDYK